MGALCRPPSLAWPAGPSGRDGFRSSHLALRKREGYVKDGGAPRADTEGAAVPAGRDPLRSPRGSTRHLRSGFTPKPLCETPRGPPKLLLCSTSSDTMGKSRSCGDPREGCSSDSPAKRRFGQSRCLLGLINFSRAEANSRGSSGSRQWPRRQQSRPLGLVASSISNPGVWRGARLQVAFLSFPDARQGSSWITLPNQGSSYAALGRQRVPLNFQTPA